MDDPPPAERVFVGREEELRQLSARLAKAQAGERQIVFVTGPAGIGKTALIDAFLDSPAVRAAVPPVWVARADCIEHHGPREAYMPVLEALERLGQRSDAGRLVQLLRRTAPTWAVQMPSLLEETDLAAELSGVAHALATTEHSVLADSVLLRTAVYEGRFADASAWMESLSSRKHEPSDAPALVPYGMDALIAATLHYAAALWFLGDPAKAQAAGDHARARARESGNPFFECGALAQSAVVDLLCRRPMDGADMAKQAIALSGEQGFAYWNAFATALNGWALIQRGQASKGSVQVEQALQVMSAARAHLFQSFFWGFLAEGHWRSGAYSAGLEAVDEGLRLAQTTLESFFEPELWRLRGELLLAQSSVTHRRARPRKRTRGTAAGPDANWPEAERSLLRALELSRAAQAKSLELRAATSLARAWHARGALPTLPRC